MSEQHKHEQNRSVAWRPDGPFAVHVWSCKTEGCPAVGKKDRAGPTPLRWFVLPQAPA